MSEHCPRDMIGYGGTPPDPRWPGEARLAVQFVVNDEGGGEYCIVHGDAGSEAFRSEIIGAAPALAQRHGRQPVYETARMYTGPDPDIDLQTVLGVTGVELG